MNQLFNLLLPWPWRAFNPITDTFVYGIFLSFIICLVFLLVKTIRRARLIGSLTKKVSEYGKSVKPDILHELKEAFDCNSELAEVWQGFADSLITRQRGENQEKIVYKTDEASLFFSEERILEQYLNLRLWNSVPALLVGIGILGTFVGLVWGLIPFSGINFAQTIEIQEAIKKLLPGVSTAFVTSVWGMLASIVFNFVEKLGIGSVSKTIATLQRALDKLFTLTTQEEISFRQEEELAQQTQALKSFSTDLADKIKIAMDNIMSESRDQRAQDSQEIVQELHKVPDAISGALAERLAPNLNNLNTIVKNIQDMTAQSRQEVVQELHKVPDAISSAMGKKLIPNLNNLNTVVEELQNQSEKLDILGQSLMESRAQSAQNSQEIVQELRNAPDAISNAMEPSFNRLNTAVENLDTTVTQSKSDIQNEMVQGREVMLRQLHDAGYALSNVITEELIPRLNNLITIISDIQSVAEQGRQEVAQELHKLGLSMTEIETLAGTVDKVSENFINVPEHVAQISDNVQELVKSAVNQTDEQFNQRLADMDAFFLRAAQTLQDVQQSAGTLLQLQNEQIEAINNQLSNSQATLASGRDMLQEMNKSITSIRQIIERMQIVSGRLTVGAEKIESAGQQLNRAGVMFSEGNQNSLAVIRETAHQIQNALAQSRPLLDNFTEGFQMISNRLNRNFQSFQTIDEGLNGIFAEIERGLNTYADTTRESINEYLRDFSEQLTQASTALARNVETLRESVEGLTEMNENQLTSAAKTLADSVEVLKESVGQLNEINKHPAHTVGNR